MFPICFLDGAFRQNKWILLLSRTSNSKINGIRNTSKRGIRIRVGKIFQPYCDSRYLELNFTNSKTVEFRRGKGTVDAICIKSILDFCYHIYKYSIEAQNLYKSDLLSIRLFVQNYLMENARTERLKNL